MKSTSFLLQVFKSKDTVVQRNLVSQDVNPDSIVKYHKTYRENITRILEVDVLAYVTPVSTLNVANNDDNNITCRRRKPLALIVLLDQGWRKKILVQSLKYAMTK